MSGSSTPQGRRDESNSLATSLQNPSSLPIKLPEPRTHLADGPQPVQSMSPKVSSNWAGRAGPVRVFAVARIGFVDLVNSDNSEIGEFRNSLNSQCVLYRHRQCALIPKIPKMWQFRNYRNSEIVNLSRPLRIKPIYGLPGGVGLFTSRCISQLTTHMSTTSLETRSPSPGQGWQERRERRRMPAARTCHRTSRGGLQGARRPQQPQHRQSCPRPSRAASTPSAYNEPATNATATVPTPNEEPWCSKPNKSKPNLWGRPRPTVSDEPMTGAAKPRDSKNL